ncbi:MAG: serine hydrolase domain-containing protein [Burkholderiaceae bacterium]
MTSLPLGTPAELGFSPQRCEALTELLQAEIDKGRLPGATVLVARRGKIALLQSLGLQDPGTRQSMRNDAIFRLYSMSKPIVSVAAMMLMEQGRFLLCDPVAQYLPEFANQQVAVERDGKLTLESVRRPATIQDLMRHTSGLTYEFSGTAAVQRMYYEHKLGGPQSGRDLAAFTRALAALPLLDQPGSVGEYSRSTDVLGRLVEVWSGQSLGDFLARKIFAPLGMTDTGFFVSAAGHGRIAEPFDHDPDGAPRMRMSEIRTPPDLESGGGGLVGTAMDYARFLQFLLNGGELDGVRLLGPHTVDFMTSDHLGAIPARDNLLEPGEGFGLGFAVRTARGLTPVPGSVGTYYWSGMAGTSFFVDPAQQMFAIMLIQAPNQRAYYRQLFRNLVYAALLE